MINCKTLVTSLILISSLSHASQPAASAADSGSSFNMTTAVALLGSAVALGHAGVAFYNYLNQPPATLEAAAASEAKSLVVSAIQNPQAVEQMAQAASSALHNSGVVSKVEQLVSSHGTLASELSTVKTAMAGELNAIKIAMHLGSAQQPKTGTGQLLQQRPAAKKPASKGLCGCGV